MKPEDFGLSRYIEIGSRLTGWNAVKSRVEQLELEMTDDQVKDVTAKIKQLADVKTQSMDDVDTVLRVCRSPPLDSGPQIEDLTILVEQTTAESPPATSSSVSPRSSMSSLLPTSRSRDPTPRTGPPRRRSRPTATKFPLLGADLA